MGTSNNPLTGVSQIRAHQKQAQRKNIDQIWIKLWQYPKHQRI